jgi:predicted ATPase
MFDHIHAKHFRAFDAIDVELKPITVVVGPNNSGKSSLFSPLRILAQTLEAGDLEVPLLLNGAFGDFGTYKDVVHGNHRGRPIDFRIGFCENPVLGRSTSPQIRPKRPKQQLGLQFKFLAKRREIILRSTELVVDGSLLLGTSYSKDTGRQTLDHLFDTAVSSAAKSSLGRQLRMTSFLPSIGPMFGIEQSTSEEIAGFDKRIRDRRRELANSKFEIQREFASFEFLGAARNPPQRTYLFSGERRSKIGAAGEHMASMLSVGAKRVRGAAQATLLDNVSRWLSLAGLAKRTSVATLTDRHYEIRVEHPTTGEIENLADVGFGNSQVLPVLVAGYACPPGSTFLVEEPEIHLHPNAQADLGEFFAELYARGVQCLVETHSEHLVLRLLKHVAEGTISHKDIVIHYVDPRENGKTVVQLGLDKLGKFTREWPHGFFPQRLKEATELSTAREKARGRS